MREQAGLLQYVTPARTLLTREREGSTNTLCRCDHGRAGRPPLGGVWLRSRFKFSPAGTGQANMIVIRGRVDPGRVLDESVGWRHLMGRGRWKLEYTARDKTGQVVDRGTFKADLSGRFVVGIDVADPGSIEIRVKGRGAEVDDSCTVRVFSADDVVNLPRKLYPYNGNVKPKAGVA